MLLGIEKSILSYTTKYKSAFGTVRRIAPVTPQYRSASPLKNQLSTPTGPIPICFEIIFFFHLRSFFVGSRICILVFTVSTGWPQTCNRDGIHLLLNQGSQKTGTPRIFYKLQIFITEVKQYQGFQIVAVYIALGVFC